MEVAWDQAPQWGKAKKHSASEASRAGDLGRERAAEPGDNQSPARLASHAECFFALPHCGAWSHAMMASITASTLLPTRIFYSIVSLKELKELYTYQYPNKSEVKQKNESN